MKIAELKPILGEGYAYLATPYAKFHQGRVAAFQEAAVLAGRLLEAGIPTFCPIAHSHPIAEFAHLDPLDYDIWLPADKPLMNCATLLLVADMPGWRDSYGVECEIREFTAAGKPIFYMSCESLALEAAPSGA